MQNKEFVMAANVIYQHRVVLLALITIIKALPDKAAIRKALARQEASLESVLGKQSPAVIAEVDKLVAKILE